MKARQVNEKVLDDVYQFILACIGKKPGAKIVISGLAFKGRPETNDLRDSFGINLAKGLRNKFNDVTLQFWDPSVDEEGMEIPSFTKIQNLDSNCQVLVLANNAPFLTSEEALFEIKKLGSDSFVVDLWDNLAATDHFKAHIITFGRPSWRAINNYE
jgi:UDP-N-acetyl-D-mannosaminuronic acid dehydrogenase